MGGYRSTYNICILQSLTKQKQNLDKYYLNLSHPTLLITWLNATQPIYSAHILENVLQFSLPNPNLETSHRLFLFPLQAFDYKHRLLSLRLSQLVCFMLLVVSLSLLHLSITITLSLYIFISFLPQ